MLLAFASCNVLIDHFSTPVHAAWTETTKQNREMRTRQNCFFILASTRRIAPPDDSVNGRLPYPDPRIANFSTYALNVAPTVGDWWRAETRKTDQAPDTTESP